LLRVEHRRRGEPTPQPQVGILHVMTGRNPPRVPADTSPEVWRRQMNAIACRSVAERLDEWAQVNQEVARLEAEGVRRRHPEYDDRQVLLACARMRYGDDLVRQAWPDDSLVAP
jgi:transposase